MEDAIQFERPVQNLVVDNPLLWVSFQVSIDALQKCKKKLLLLHMHKTMKNLICLTVLKAALMLHMNVCIQA